MSSLLAEAPIYWLKHRLWRRPNAGRQVHVLVENVVGDAHRILATPPELLNVTSVDHRRTVVVASTGPEGFGTMRRFRQEITESDEREKNECQREPRQAHATTSHVLAGAASLPRLSRLGAPRGTPVESGGARKLRRPASSSTSSSAPA